MDNLVDNLVDVFCDIDDFCAVFIPQWQKQCLTDGTRKRQRPSRMDIEYLLFSMRKIIVRGPISIMRTHGESILF